MFSVCMISSLHGLYDDRIYWKEALSLKNHGYNLIHITVGNDDRDFISQHGIRLIQVGKKRYFINPYLDILYRKITFKPNVYKKILRICASLHSDIYHFHDLQINKIGKQLKNLPHKPKVIYDVHEDYPDLIRSLHPSFGLLNIITNMYAYLAGICELSKAQSYDYIIAAVDHIRDKFAMKINSKKMQVVYNYTTLSPPIIKAFENKKYDAVYCGQISNIRGVFKILEAVKILKKKKPEIKVLFLGPISDSRLKIQVESYINSNALQENIILKRPVPYEEIDEFLQDSKIGLGIFLPVSMFFYGVQVKTFEYMAYGLPIVCSNFGAISRYVSETNSGITVDPLAPFAISEAINRLLTDKDLYGKLQKNALQAIKNTYNWKSEEEKLLTVYNNLLSSKMNV
jgi:glycosyltransferase involved in cell wall biosynthesis